MSGPGRNDPCPCGSGKKYKRCCLNTSPSGEALYRRVQQRATAARQHLFAFGRTPHFSQYVPLAWEQFWEGCEPTAEQDDEADQIRFWEWFLLSYRLPSRRTILELLLTERGERLPADEREVLQGWLASKPGVFQVVQVEPEKGVELRDVLRGGPSFLAWDLGLSRQVVRWDVLVCRVVQTNSLYHLSGAATLVGAAALERIKAFAQAELAGYQVEVPGADWDDFLAARFERLNRFLYAPQFPELRTPEGDPVIFSKAVFDLLDRDAARRKLDRAPMFDALPDDSESPELTDFTWLADDPDDASSAPGSENAFTFAAQQVANSGEAQRTLGRVEVATDRLILECMSQQRLERGKQLLQELLGGAVRHRVDTFQDPQQALAEHRGDEPTEPSVPSEVEARLAADFYQQEQAAWLDRSIPALGGLTPRQASQDPSGRPALENLLRQFENSAERARMQGRASYDLDWMRASLGLDQETSADADEEELPPLVAEAVGEIADAVYHILGCLIERDEQSLAGALVPGEWADTFVGTFGLPALAALLGIECDYLPEHISIFGLEIEEKQTRLEVRLSKGAGDEPKLIGFCFRPYRRYLRLERALPFGLNQPAREATSSDPAVAALLSGKTHLPPLPNAARDGVDEVLLAELPRNGVTVLEQANALRLWRDFLRKFRRTATISGGQEAAWAAATEYVVRVLDSLPGSQKSVAQAYRVSPSVLSDHAKLIQTTLKLRQLDPRYTLSPGKMARAMAGLRRSFGLEDLLPFGAGRGRSYVP